MVDLVQAAVLAGGTAHGVLSCAESYQRFLYDAQGNPVLDTATGVQKLCLAQDLQSIQERSSSQSLYTPSAHLLQSRIYYQCPWSLVQAMISALQVLVRPQGQGPAQTLSAGCRPTSHPVASDKLLMRMRGVLPMDPATPSTTGATWRLLPAVTPRQLCLRCKHQYSPSAAAPRQATDSRAVCCVSVLEVSMRERTVALRGVRCTQLAGWHRSDTVHRPWIEGGLIHIVTRPSETAYTERFTASLLSLATARLTAVVDVNQSVRI